MRGSPLWQLLLVLVAFAAMGVPVWRLTRPAQASLNTLATPAPEPTGLTGPVTLETALEFAPAPTDFDVSYLGQAVLQGNGQASASASWKVQQFPAEGVDLVLHAVWSRAGDGSEQTAAARMRVRLPDGREIDKSFWTKSGETLDAVFTVPGSAATPQP